MSSQAGSTDKQVDVVIVGGGSAGCVLASRLSEDTQRTVLLLEAGADTPPNREPEDILDSYPGRAYLNKNYTWPGLDGYMQPVPHNEASRPPLTRYEQARIMGGGSSINGQVASRGFSEDYEEWVRLGASGWGWDDVKPFFHKLERDLDFNGPNHGKSGPMPIRRIFPDNWDGLTRAAAASFKELGFEYRPDMNDTELPGYSPAPCTNAYGRRVSTATAYLTPTVRARRNLTIQTEISVTRILFAGRRAVGVEVDYGTEKKVIHAASVVITAGAIHTPALLLRSGLGPANNLKSLEVPVVADLPGVGLGLQDHSAVSLSAYLRPENRFDEASRRHIHMHLRYNSQVPDTPPMDMVINTASRSAWHPLGHQIGSFQIFVGKPFSRGSVRLQSPHFHHAPEVRFELLSDFRDRLRLMEGVSLMSKALAREPLRQVALDPFPSSYSSRARSVGRLSLSNYLLTKTASHMMDGPGWLRRFFIRTAIAPDYSLGRIQPGSDELEEFVTSSVTPTWHACSTCRMGQDDDPMAVTNHLGQVRNVDGLWLADASIMPGITRGNTGLPVIMMAEKLADHWRKSNFCD